MKNKQNIFIGVDGGGTKTRVLAATLEGRILADLRGGPSNFQFLGTPQAKTNLAQLLLAVKKKLEKFQPVYQGAFYGMAGADRPSDHGHIRRWITSITPAKNFGISADPIPMLRLASPDGSGIALVAGTGANCIGRDSQGKESAVGGWLGDWVGGTTIGAKTINLAVESQDGRGKKTILEKMLCRRYKVKEVTDLLDWLYTDRPKRKQLHYGDLPPLVFKAAALKDAVALKLLREQGKELFRMAQQVEKDLFSRSSPLIVAMGGSLLQRAEPPIIQTSFKKYFKAYHPKVKFVAPVQDPVYGALLLAYDQAKVQPPSLKLLGVQK